MYVVQCLTLCSPEAPPLAAPPRFAHHEVTGLQGWCARTTRRSPLGGTPWGGERERVSGGARPGGPAQLPPLWISRSSQEEVSDGRARCKPAVQDATLLSEIQSSGGPSGLMPIRIARVHGRACDGSGRCHPQREIQRCPARVAQRTLLAVRLIPLQKRPPLSEAHHSDRRRIASRTWSVVPGKEMRTRCSPRPQPSCPAGSSET